MKELDNVMSFIQNASRGDRGRPLNCVGGGLPRIEERQELELNNPTRLTVHNAAKNLLRLPKLAVM